MNILDTLLDLGEAAVRNTIPMSGMVIDLVKEIAGDDDDVDNMTGKQMADVIKRASPEQQARIIESYNAVTMNESDNFRKIQESMNNPATAAVSRRGEVVYLLSVFYCIWVSLVVAVICYVAYITKKFPDEWIVGAVLAFPSSIIGAYFGFKSGEINKLNDLNSPNTLSKYTEGGKKGLVATAMSAISGVVKR